MSQCPSCGEVKCPGMPDCGLLCIAGSPSPEHGGFHEKTVAIAKSALAELTTLRASLAEYQGAMRAQDQREDAAGVRCGVLRGYSGCDWPDAVAEEVLTLRASLEQARKEPDWHAFYTEAETKRYHAEEVADSLRAELEQVRGAWVESKREIQVAHNVINSELGRKCSLTGPLCPTCVEVVATMPSKKGR